MLELPLLRWGRPYTSLSTDRLYHVATGEPVAEVSLAEPALLARDLDRAADARTELAALPVDRLLAICRDAARRFAEDELPVGDALQRPDDYLASLAATTGIPIALGRANLEKVRSVLAGMEEVLAGLTRGLDLSALDGGWIEDGGNGRGGGVLGFRAETDALGAVLPSNSPGVHSLWLPALPLKTPVALKPGSREPWTPLRVAAAMTAAGCPPSAFGFYPTSHAGATEILMRTGRSMVFGDRTTVEPWIGDPRVEIHGPGWSKVIVGADRTDRWRDSLDVIAESVAANGGRSCINASGVWVAERDGRSTGGAPVGRELAQALAERLVAIEARPLDDPGARLAAFPDPALAHRLSAHIDRQLAGGGAVDLTAELRAGGEGGASRVAEAGGCTFLLPTVIWCDDPDHPLARAEYLFPFVSVVELPADEIPARLGASLVVTALTDDRDLAGRLVACRSIDRLNLGDLPTTHVSWDQPHEGNLFEHLYRRRAIADPALLATADAGAAARTPAAEAGR